MFNLFHRREVFTVALDPKEYRIVRQALLELRQSELDAGRHADAVNDLLIKLL